MSNEYPSFTELHDLLCQKRSTIKLVMEKNGVYDWPEEKEFATWLGQELRLSSMARQDLARLANDVLTIKATIQELLSNKLSENR